MILAQPVAGTARARIRQSVRACVLVAVLLGLFLMHGGPAAAAGGCHGAMPDMETAVSRSAPMAAHPDTMRPAPATTAAHPAGHPAPASATATARADEAMQGALCLATTPRSQIPPPPLVASALVFPAAIVLPRARPGHDGTRRRGPPADGRHLLLQVCVART
ncbi:hypothetical protein ABT187_23845 [Streptomyces sp. NPDC001817]|uniref:hypothetical protein n=1 Tax=Streptomyces sp. NPDC001817 TaxID=3154398 RepID=UPI00331D5F96